MNITQNMVIIMYNNPLDFFEFICSVGIITGAFVGMIGFDIGFYITAICSGLCAVSCIINYLM